MNDRNEIAKSATKTRTPVWIRIVLALSLALNLAVLGVVVGAALRHGGGDGMRGPRHSGGATLYRALPPDERRAFRKDLIARNPDLHNPARNGQDAVIAALRTRPFDAQALSAALSAESARRDAWQQAVRQLWQERVAAMDDTARAAFADRIQEISDHRSNARAGRRKAGDQRRVD